MGQRIWGGGGGGAPSGKLCVVTSVASSLVLGGGGGQDPQMYRQKMYIYCASTSETYIFRTQNTSAYIYNQCIFWRYKRYYTDKTLKLREKKSMNMRASGASELRKFSHFHMLKLLFPSIFCWYFRYFVSETFSLYHLYDTIYKRQYTDKALTLRKCICAIERSERA